jgi:hypothetical protein
MGMWSDLPFCRHSASFDLLKHPSRYWATPANLRMFKVPANAIIKARSVAQLVLLVPLAIQLALDHNYASTFRLQRDHTTAFGICYRRISVRPHFGSTKHYSGM